MFTRTLFDTDQKEIIEIVVPADTSADEDIQAALLEALRCGLDLSRLFFSSSSYYNMDFSGMNLSHADLSRSTFIKCNFTGTDLSHAAIYDITLQDCKTEGWILPERYFNVPEGPISIWKVVGSNIRTYRGNKGFRLYIIELEVPADADRVIAAGKIDRIRVSKATPVKIFDLEGNELAVENFKVYPPQITTDQAYRKGMEYLPDDFDGDMWKSCSHGINGFLDYETAVEYAREELFHMVVKN